MVKTDQEHYEQLCANYAGLWVAYRDDWEVVASAEDIDQLYDQLERAGMDGPEVIVEFIEEPDRIYIYAH